MKKKLIFLLSMASLMPLGALSQTVSARAYYYDKTEMKTVETTSIDNVEPPIEVTFKANPAGMDDYMPSYEWHFSRQVGTQAAEELFVRYEEETSYTFSETGTYNITLKTYLGTDSVELPSDPITVVIPASSLEFYNALSPNGDGFNDTLKPKVVKGIVKFHAYILNRWGQRLYEWTDPNGEWDGTYKGRVVNDGVYYLLVKATGADGIEYNIRKDVNLLTKHGPGRNSGENE